MFSWHRGSAQKYFICVLSFHTDIVLELPMVNKGQLVNQGYENIQYY